VATSSHTAFQVAPNGNWGIVARLTLVYLSHNHFSGEKVEGRVRGILPCDRHGAPNVLSPRPLHELSFRDAITLTAISESWRMREEVTEFQVMLKSLQQARMQGVWEPCLKYLYKWGDSYVAVARGSDTNMYNTLDVGAYTFSGQSSFNREMCLPLI
jgi:hypothetical protein